MLRILKIKLVTHGNFYQYIATITGNLASLSFGLSLGWPSPSLPKLLENYSEIHVTNAEGSWLATLNTIGSVFSTIIAAFSANKFGRKRALLLSSIVYVLGWLLIAFATCLELLMCGRFVTGIADGLTSVFMGMYISEIAHQDLRGCLGILQLLTMLTGSCLINIIGSYLSISETAFVCACIPLLHFVSFLTMPESSYYLLMKGNEEDARKSLQKLRGVSDVEAELMKQRDALKEQKNESGNFFQIFSASANRKALFICVMIIAVTFGCGAVAIGNYLQIVIKDIDETVSPEAFSVVYTFTYLVTALVPILFVDKIGRKPLLLISALGSFVALALEGAYLYLRNCTDFDTTNVTLFPLILLIMFNFFQSIGMGSIPFLLIDELFPTKIKLYACCFFGIFVSVLIILVCKFFQISRDSLGMHVPFLTFSSVCIINLLVVIFIVPETKKKTLEEIQEYLKK